MVNHMARHENVMFYYPNLHAIKIAHLLFTLNDVRKCFHLKRDCIKLEAYS